MLLLKLQHVGLALLSPTTDNSKCFTQKPHFAYAGAIYLAAMLDENLTILGLSKKEAMLYMQLLRCGPSPASSLAKRLHIKRVSAYPLLESLEAKGLVTFKENKTGRQYFPHDPECLLQTLEQQNAELKYRMELAKKCIQQFHELSVWA